MDCEKQRKFNLTVFPHSYEYIFKVFFLKRFNENLLKFDKIIFQGETVDSETTKKKSCLNSEM